MIIAPNIAGKLPLSIKSQAFVDGSNQSFPNHAPGDLLLLFIGTNSSPSYPAAPSGSNATWTLAKGTNAQVADATAIYYAVATSSSHTTGTLGGTGYAMVMQGQAANPIGGTGGSSSPYYASAEGYNVNGGYMRTVNQSGTSKIFYVANGYATPPAGTNANGFTVVYSQYASGGFNHSLVVLSRDTTTDLDVYANYLRPFNQYFYSSATGVEILEA